jgi:hypothetical protein
MITSAIQSFFRWNNFKRPKKFSGLWYTDYIRFLIHSGTAPIVVITTFESFRRKFSEKNKIDSESECSEDYASLYRFKIESLQAKLQRKAWNVAFLALF